MKKFLKKILHYFGFHITKIAPEPIFNNNSPAFFYDYNYELDYDLSKEALNEIKIIRKNTMLPYVNLVTLYEQVVYCEKNCIAGDFVECGVWKGGAVGLMVLANLKYGKKRHLHLFDIFDDICEPDPELDGKNLINEIQQITGNKMKFTGQLKPIKNIYKNIGGHGTVEDCKVLLEDIIKYDNNYIHYHKGWFQNTVPVESLKINGIAILRLDGDLYASTKVCLEHLYDKVVEGGIVIIDDYGAYEGCKKAVDEFIVKRNLKVFLSYSNKICRYWVKH